MRVACLIPAYNEARRVGDTIRAIKSLQQVDEIIVIDDGSTDATAEEAEAAGADRVLRLDSNIGKGGAMNRGLAETSADVLLLLDADLGSSAQEGAKLLEPVLSGLFDMSVAILPRTGKKAGFGFVVRLARWGIRRLAKLDVQAPLSGLRAVKREVVDRAGGFEPGWGVEIGLTVAAAQAGFTIVEVPTEFTHRVTGRSIRGFVHRGRQFAHVVWFIARKWRK